MARQANIDETGRNRTLGAMLAEVVDGLLLGVMAMFAGSLH